VDWLAALTATVTWLLVLFAVASSFLCLRNARLLGNSKRVIRLVKAGVTAAIGIVYLGVELAWWTPAQSTVVFRPLVLLLFASLIAREIIEAPHGHV